MNQIDYGMRVYDPRIGRFLSTDPLTGSYPWYTPYQFAGNKPIWAIDRDGAEEWYYYKRDEYGWAPSKIFSGPYRKEYANQLGYYTAEQAHHFMVVQDGIEMAKTEVQRRDALYESAKAVARSRNLFTLAFDLSPIKAGMDAYDELEKGHFGMAALIGVTAVTDFSPLFRAAGREYAGVARGFAARYSMENLWNLEWNFVRGMLIEAKVSAQYVKQGFEWLAETASPFFRSFDFYNAADELAVSLKTVNAKKSFDFKKIYENIDQLKKIKSARRNAQFGREFGIKDVRLDIMVLKGYDQTRLKEVVQYGERELGAGKVTVTEQ